MDIEYLKRFVVIGRHLNFRKASDELFVSQPALSHSIAALEKEIGTPVFIRNTKNVSFTPAGKILFDAAQEIIERYEFALTDISKISDYDDSILRIGYAGSALDNSLTPLLRTFKKSHPDIDVNLTRHHGTEIRSTIENQQIQFAVVYEEHAKNFRNVKYEIIDNEEFTLMVNSSDPLAEKSSVTAEDLADLPLIICERESAPNYYGKVMDIFAHCKIEPNIVQTVRLISDIYRVVDMGAGSAIVSYAPDRKAYGAFDLSFVPIEIDNKEILAHKKTIAWCGELSPNGKKFIKTVRSFYNIDK